MGGRGREREGRRKGEDKAGVEGKEQNFYEVGYQGLSTQWALIQKCN